MTKTTCPKISTKIITGMLLCFLVISGTLPFPSLTSAQVITNEIRVVASPTRVGDDRSLLLQPGEKRQITLKVRNVSSQPIDALTLVQDFILDEDGSTPIPVELADGVSNRWSLANWVTIVPNSQTLQPNETAQLNALIEVPTDALPGGRYAMVVHEPLPVGTAQDVLNQVESTASESRVNPKVGTLLYVIVDGPINEAAFIRDFSFPKFTEYGPVPFTMIVDNQSDIHITPKISVDIYSLFGQKVATIPLETKNVFPVTSREFSGEWDKVWGTGFYRAEVTMSFGEQGQVAMARTSFWFFPATLVIGIGAGLLGLLAITLAVRRHLLHRAMLDKKRIQSLENQVAHLTQQDTAQNITQEFGQNSQNIQNPQEKREE